MLIEIAKQVVPHRLQPLMGWLYQRFRGLFLPCQCPFCLHRSQGFLPYGSPVRAQARCANCGSLERHRLAWLYLRRKTDLFDGKKPKRLLHIAPEPALQKVFERIPGLDYRCGDKHAQLAAQRMDITAIGLPDDQFDVIYCSHVLEHIEDDRQAVAELYRVLKPGGWALLQVPILLAETYEDASIQTPEERRRVFGQWDHVRVYGKDFKARLEQVGFKVTVIAYARKLGRRKRRFYGLPLGEDIHFCRKLAR